MINTILIFPIIAGILMLLVRKRAFDNLLLNVYAIMHFIITLMLTFTTKMSGASHYFAVDNTNKIFLLVLSFVFLMVTISDTQNICLHSGYRLKTQKYAFTGLWY